MTAAGTKLEHQPPGLVASSSRAEPVPQPSFKASGRRSGVQATPRAMPCACSTSARQTPAQAPARRSRSASRSYSSGAMSFVWLRCLTSAWPPVDERHGWMAGGRRPLPPLVGRGATRIRSETPRASRLGPIRIDADRMRPVDPCGRGFPPVGPALSSGTTFPPRTWPSARSAAPRCPRVGDVP